MQLRVARHTNKINEILNFYINVIGLELLGSFKNHHNYDGVFIGKKEKDWHLEFTTTNEKISHYPDEDDCLVFYPANQNEYDEILERIKSHQIKVISAKNPYWNENGISIKDPDEFIVVISSLKIKQYEVS